MAGPRFWQGTSHGQPGTLAGMIRQMATTPQPRFLSHLVAGFGSVTAAHGFTVNLTAVIALALTGAAFLTGRRTVTRPAVIAFTVLCLADWVLVEDFGFLGGLGTDPNSMIPMALLAIAGYLALTRAVTSPQAATTGSDAPEPAGTKAQDQEPPAVLLPHPGPRWRELLRPAAMRRSLAAASLGSVTAVAAVGVIAVGAVPMAAAQASTEASTILVQAIDGSGAGIGGPARDFTLTGQHGRQVTLSSLRGKVVLLGFLDAVCTTNCPLGAQEFKQAGQLLGGQARQVELVAVNFNTDYSQLAYTQAFDRQEGLASVPDWLYLTGSPAQLRQVFREYGVPSQTLPAEAMLGHSDSAFVIDRSGRMREELNMDPGPGTAAGPAAPALSPATSLAAGGTAWAAVPMGSSGADLFWELFVLPSGAARWSLVTPPASSPTPAAAGTRPPRHCPPRSPGSRCGCCG